MYLSLVSVWVGPIIAWREEAPQGWTHHTSSPRRVECRRLAEHEAADLRRPLRIQTEVRQPREQLGQRRARLEPCQVDADAHMRPLGECEVAPSVRAASSKMAIFGTDRGIVMIFCRP